MQCRYGGIAGHGKSQCAISSLFFEEQSPKRRIEMGWCLFHVISPKTKPWFCSRHQTGEENITFLKGVCHSLRFISSEIYYFLRTRRGFIVDRAALLACITCRQTVCGTQYFCRNGIPSPLWDKWDDSVTYMVKVRELRCYTCLNNSPAPSPESGFSQSGWFGKSERAHYLWWWDGLSEFVGTREMRWAWREGEREWWSSC